VIGRVSNLEHRAEVFAALGDPRRLEIAEELSRSDRTPGELIEKFELSSALLAHHLDVLEHAGLIERTHSHADGRKRFVRLVGHHRALLSDISVPSHVMFVCRHNSARSQLAAAMWRHMVGTHAESAGTQPAAAVHPLAVSVARRHHLNLRAARPSLYNASNRRGLTIITVCDQSHDDLTAPLSRLHWSLPDPVETGTVAAFESTYHELIERMRPIVTRSTTSAKQEPTTKSKEQI
jgi:protein-tyrosine-phosphatase/DNA-binding HxlR family transcriptional regulator